MLTPVFKTSCGRTTAASVATWETEVLEQTVLALRAICQAAGSDPEAVRYAASLARIGFEIVTSAGVYRWKRRLLLTWLLGLL